jgi:branched-chain amino acid transport system ATP-binding protein
MLKISNVRKRFGGIHALEEVNLSIKRGGIFSLIGPNGAGKTTLFNLITGSLPADSGTIVFLDNEITSLKPHTICRRGIARTYQQKNLFPNLSVFENVSAGLLKERTEEGTRKEKVRDILGFLDIGRRAQEIVSGLPPLDSKLVELGRALATGPKLLLLDELIGGLLPSETEKICLIVEALRDKGYTIFQIGHEMRPIMRTSDWIFVLDDGRKIAEGTPDEIKTNQAVHDVYLE